LSLSVNAAREIKSITDDSAENGKFPKSAKTLSHYIFSKTLQNRYHSQSLAGGTGHFYKYVLGPVRYGVVLREVLIHVVCGMEELVEEDFSTDWTF